MPEPRRNDSYARCARFMVDTLEKALTASTQAAVSEKLKVGEQTVSRWLAGDVREPRELRQASRLAFSSGKIVGLADENALTRLYRDLRDRLEGGTATEPPSPLIAPYLREAGVAFIEPSAPTVPAEPQPHLSLRPRDGVAAHHFTSRSLDVIGRDAEQQQLRRFAAGDPGFQWFQLAGVGGQGKSQLALELAIERDAEGWRTGFLEGDELAEFDWAQWRPDRPSLLALDYVTGAETALQRLLRGMARRDLTHPVRLLLLERQRWDRSGLGEMEQARESSPQRAAFALSSGPADWFLKLSKRHDGRDSMLMDPRFETGCVELLALSRADLVAITRNHVERSGGAPSCDDKLIEDALARFDAEGRPLYAYFLAEALAHGAGAGIESWALADLLDAVLQREQRTRWQVACPETPLHLGEETPALRLAVLATMTRGLDAKRLKDVGWPRTTSDILRQALALVDGP